MPALASLQGDRAELSRVFGLTQNNRRETTKTSRKRDRIGVRRFWPCDMCAASLKLTRPLSANRKSSYVYSGS